MSLIYLSGNGGGVLGGRGSFSLKDPVEESLLVDNSHFSCWRPLLFTKRPGSLGSCAFLLIGRPCYVARSVLFRNLILRPFIIFLSTRTSRILVKRQTHRPNSFSNNLSYPSRNIYKHNEGLSSPTQKTCDVIPNARFSFFFPLRTFFLRFLLQFPHIHEYARGIINLCFRSTFFQFSFLLC